MYTRTNQDWSKLLQAVGNTLQSYGQKVKTDKWQGMKLPDSQQFFEVLNITLVGNANKTELELQTELKPNLPWAQEHFKERVDGIPLNPGNSYKIWPFYGNDSNVRTENKKFSHTYMERMWPKYAGQSPDTSGNIDRTSLHSYPNSGIRYNLGDLDSLINHLKKDPYSRQAYLPIWFPEDTGVEHGGRVPCSLGYHFIIRNGFLHCNYYLRSCDYFRHLPDDLYLAIKLMKWVIQQTELDVKPGFLTTHITSLHIFDIETPKLAKHIK
jgi:hypothetical protein